MANFNEYALYYDAFYGDKNYREEVETVCKLINRNTKKEVKTILSMGCGTGRHDSEFNNCGYTVKGIDISEKMISVAKKTIPKQGGEGLSFDVGDVRCYRDGVKYDTCVSLFHVMSYQNGNQDIIDAMRTAYEELEEGGLFVFDVWYGPGVLSYKPEVRIKEVSFGDYTYIRHATPVIYPDRNVVDVNYDVLVLNNTSDNVERFKETHSMRYFFTPEIEFYLNSVGFELLECLDCKTLKNVTFDSWTAYFVAKKER